MNILLTGGSGYVGKSLINQLAKNKLFNIFSVVRTKSDLPKNVKAIDYDSDFKENIIKSNPDFVIHLASYLTSSSEIEETNKLIQANITFGTVLLDALKVCNIKLFINTGSYSEYHFNTGDLNPTYFYSATKTAFRSILKYYSELKKFKVVHVIPYTIYGGVYTKMKILDILFGSLDSNEKIKLSPGLQLLDFIHISDVVDFYIHVIENSHILQHHESYHLGSGRVINLQELAIKIEKLTGKKIQAQWGAQIQRERDTTYACAPIAKLKETLNWNPKISLDEGLKMYYLNIIKNERSNNKD
jgi:CDP-paratose synthetase